MLRLEFVARIRVIKRSCKLFARGSTAVFGSLRLPRERLAMACTGRGAAHICSVPLERRRTAPVNLRGLLRLALQPDFVTLSSIVRRSS